MHPQSAPLFHELPFVSQLLLWTMRQLVYCRELDQPLNRIVGSTYAAAGLPGGIAMVAQWLSRLSAASLQPIVFNVPKGVELMPDEHCLCRCVSAVLGDSSDCPCLALAKLAHPNAHPLLLRKLSTVIEHMLSAQLGGGLGGCGVRPARAVAQTSIN